MRLFAFALAAALVALPGTAVSMENPFIVCVTEPCGPQLPDLPLPPRGLIACAGLPCDVINLVCEKAVGAVCVE